MFLLLFTMAYVEPSLMYACQPMRNFQSYCHSYRSGQAVTLTYDEIAEMKNRAIGFGADIEVVFQDENQTTFENVITRPNQQGL